MKIIKSEPKCHPESSAAVNTGPVPPLTLWTTLTRPTAPTLDV